MQVGHRSQWVAGSHLPIHRRGHDIKQEDEKDPGAWLCSSDTCSVAMDVTLLTIWWWQIFQQQCEKCVYLVFFSLHKREKNTYTSAIPVSATKTDVKGRFPLKHRVCGGQFRCWCGNFPPSLADPQRGGATGSCSSWSRALIASRSNWLQVWKELFRGPSERWICKGHRLWLGQQLLKLDCPRKSRLLIFFKFSFVFVYVSCLLENCFSAISTSVCVGFWQHF